MRLVASLSAALISASIAVPGLAASDDTRLRLAQAAPAGPPTSGWNTPGATPRPQAGPPNSGWGAPSASPQATPAAPPAGWSAPGAPASAPAAPPPGSWSGGGGAASGRNCLGEIQPLLADAETKGKAIQAAAKSKQQPVVCQAFRNLAAAEAKLIKYFDDHGTQCQIPPDAMKARKGNYAKIVEIRTKVCDTAGAAPRAPSLSDALGTSRIPTLPSESTPAAKRGSTFDTLTGNPLAR